jgi:parallel beta-helix repeat protein
MISRNSWLRHSTFVLPFVILFATAGYLILSSSHATVNADINGDGVVNILDFSILASNYGKANQTFSQGDINGDGTVNILDFSILASQWGQKVTTCSGVNVTSSTNLQSIINANPAGTTFCFAPGTYVLTTFITPQTNDKFISTVRRAAILTGNNTYNGGIADLTWEAAPGVLIQGFVIEHFNNPWNGTFPRSPVSPDLNWIVQDNEIAYNSESGIHIGNSSKVLNNYIHDNGRYGFEGGPASNVLIDGNEVSNNNTAHSDPNNDAGGSKMIGIPGNGSYVGGITRFNDTITNNYVHNNYGNGIWCDIDCDGFIISNNTVTNNGGTGIFSEISWNMTITGNTASGNGSIPVMESPYCYYGQIESGYSANVEIANNTVTAPLGTNGICAADGDRGTDPAYPSAQINLHVHDNTEYLAANSQTGLAGRAPSYLPSANNRFINNHYHVPSLSGGYFEWSIAPLNWSNWQAIPQDSTGSIVSP